MSLVGPFQLGLFRESTEVVSKGGGLLLSPLSPSLAMSSLAAARPAQHACAQRLFVLEEPLPVARTWFR